MLEEYWIGPANGLSVHKLAMVIGGCLIGTFHWDLRVSGPMSIIAIMIRIAIFNWVTPSAALILLAGVYYGAIFGGSTSPILLNGGGVAGTRCSLGRYPMADGRGKAGKALTIAPSHFAAAHGRCYIADDFCPMLSSCRAAVPSANT